MPKFRGRFLGHAALLVVAALVATACGTSQTAQQPSPSPSPSPGPGGTVTVAGKVLFGERFSREPVFEGPPARDGTVVGYWVTSTLPAGASRVERAMQAIASNPKARGAAAAARALLDRLNKARARSKVVQPKIAYPITAPPAATTTTTGGEYTLNVPASLVGQQITVCVLGPNVTGSPNPGDPIVPGLCGTMTVQANQGGSTFVNRMSFVMARQQLGTYFVLETQSNIFGAAPIPQATPISLVTLAPLTAADNAFITNRLIVGMDPAAYPNASVYAGNNPATTAALQVVGSVSGATYNFRGRVQWRGDRVQDAPYQLDARGGDDSVLFRDDSVRELACEWTPANGDRLLNRRRSRQIVESGVQRESGTSFLWLMTTDSVILTPTAQAGYFVFPVTEPLGCVPFRVAQDTSAPRFGEAPSTLPESSPSGSRNFDVNAAPGNRGQVVVPFPEPLLADPTAGEDLFAEQHWTLFIPANDQDDFLKAGDWDDNWDGGDPVPDINDGTAAAGWDAHVGNFVDAAGSAHLDLSGRTDAITGMRLRFSGCDPADATDPEITCPPPGNQTFRVDWSAQAGDGWANTGSTSGARDPINVQDLGGNSTAPGAGSGLQWTGNVVP